MLDWHVATVEAVRLDTLTLKTFTLTLPEGAPPLGTRTKSFVCDPTIQVEAAANFLLEVGSAPEHVLTERFGPTGIS